MSHPTTESADAALPATTPVAPELTRLRLWVGNAVVAPVMLWVAQRWSLRAEREAPGVNWPMVLEPVPDPDAFVQALMQGLGAFLVAVVVFRLAWMRWARPGTRTRRVALWALLGVWVLAWLGGCAAAWRTQANQKNLQASQPLMLKVVAVQQLDANSRSEGGGRVFVEWPEQGGLYRVVLPNPSPELLTKPSHIQLTVAAGRWNGWFVTGWQLPDAAPAPSPTKEGT